MNIILKISEELGIGEKAVSSVLELLGGKATVPFIARYRKEATGALDEEKIALIRDRYEYYEGLEKRKEFILKTLAEKKLLTAELESAIASSFSADEIEDLYLPYREGRKTRAKAAEEKGLKPLAIMILSGKIPRPFEEAEKYIDPGKELENPDDVIDGCKDIIAGMIAEDSNIRNSMRVLFRKESFIESNVYEKKREEGKKYLDYYEYRERAQKAPSHRVLAVFRGSAEKILSVRIRPDEEKALHILNKAFYLSFPEAVCTTGENRDIVEKALRESYARLLLPSMENAVSGELKEKADDYSISVFASSLKALLLEPPYGNKPVVAVDPGIRTGSKVVFLDSRGCLTGYTVLDSINPGDGKSEKNKNRLDIIKGFIDKYRVEAVAVGNGTGSREISGYLKKELGEGIRIITVNESGASVYSASATARKEFPDLDITFRGAVSIGRRLQDPLSELIKIDPESIGVGQYQHDINRKKLKKALDDVVSFCVNSVGADLNSAGTELLSHVSGIGSAAAANIVLHRIEHGLFRSREELLKVRGIGKNVFEQAAGFLRISGGSNPLDRSAVHPESYHIAERIAKDLGLPVENLIGKKELLAAVRPEKYADGVTGIYTVKDIIAELEKPGRDPRDEFELFTYMEGINAIGDLANGMTVSGTVTNVTAFGAFVDIGVHQDALIHKSMISKDYVRDPSDYLRVNQKVKAVVIEVDIERKRISLSMKDL